MLKSTSLDRVHIGFASGFKSKQYKRFNNFAISGVFVTRPTGYDCMSVREVIGHLVNEIVYEFTGARSQVIMTYGLLTIQGMTCNANDKIDALVSISPPYGEIGDIDVVDVGCTCTSMPVYLGYSSTGTMLNISRTVRSDDIDCSVSIKDVMNCMI